MTAKNYIIPNILAKVAVTVHIIIPQTVGIINDIPVHFQLRVSFLIVKQLVEQGK